MMYLWLMFTVTICYLCKYVTTIYDCTGIFMTVGFFLCRATWLFPRLEAFKNRWHGRQGFGHGTEVILRGRGLFSSEKTWRPAPKKTPKMMIGNPHSQGTTFGKKKTGWREHAAKLHVKSIRLHKLWTWIWFLCSVTWLSIKAHSF
jgi:hypothetical protein